MAWPLAEEDGLANAARWYTWRRCFSNLNRLQVTPPGPQSLQSHMYSLRADFGAVLLAVANGVVDAEARRTMPVVATGGGAERLLDRSGKPARLFAGDCVCRLPAASGVAAAEVRLQAGPIMSIVEARRLSPDEAAGIVTEDSAALAVANAVAAAAAAATEDRGADEM